MKVIDMAAKTQEDEKPGALAGILERLRQSFSSKEMRSQEAAAKRLGRVLDNRFTLVRNLALEGAPVDFPILFVAGPPGLWVLHASALRGLFRANEGQWESMIGRGKNFRPVRPNLIEQIQTAAQAMTAKLESLGMNVSAPETALLFVDPGAHIDTQRPAVRVVQADALERFATQMLKADIILDADHLRHLVDGLTKSQWAATEMASSEAAFADLEGRVLAQPNASQPSRLSQIGSEEPKIFQRIGQQTAFSRRQWIWIAILLVVNFVILTAAILFAVATLR